MTRHTLDLATADWHFGQVPRRPFTAPDIYDLPAVTEWLPATVPGNVRTDLLALGRIPDPFFGEQYKESLWVEDVDWWYRCIIEPPSLENNYHVTARPKVEAVSPLGAEIASALRPRNDIFIVEHPHKNDPLRPSHEDANISSSFILHPSSLFFRAFLTFDGIDYLSAIFVNGSEVARHEGMFSRQTIEITAALREGPADIAVRLWGSGALPQRRLSWRQRLWQKIAAPLYRSWVGIYPDRSATLKCQMSFGWDFAPPIRTMGIWDEVSLVISGPVFIAEASSQSTVVSEQNAASSSGFSPFAPADLEVLLTLDANQPIQTAAAIRVTPANFTGSEFGPFDFSLDLPAGRSEHRLTCHLPEAALWQPWDRGQPHLYNVHISLTEPDGAPLDDITLRTGIRSMEWRDWRLTVNGQPEFLRGLNWVPADSFPGRLRPGHYAAILKMARESGANLLRVWGGGLREKRAFYDLCDMLGLLVWQEFPFACMFLGSYPSDPPYLALVEAECSSIVRQLRHHPSLALWCGGNEFSRSFNQPLLKTLATVVVRHDETRPFIPVSPSSAHGGDAHNWQVWHGSAPIRAYQSERAAFLSEFGLQALPHLNTLQAALPDPTTGWSTHHADLPKLVRYISSTQINADNPQINADNPQINADLKRSAEISGNQRHQRPIKPQNYFSDINIHNLQFTIHNSQLAQSTALQTAIEHMRRRKGRTGGVCLWQFNEPWPAISWAIVDYFGRPKLAYERLRDWYAPLFVSLNFPVGQCWQAGDTFAADIWAGNDSLQHFNGCELEAYLDGALPETHRFDLPPDSSICVGRLSHRLEQPPGQIALNLYHNGKLIARNRYDLNWADESHQPILARFKRWVADWVLR